MAYESESDMETVELSDVDADVTAAAVADQLMDDADSVPQPGRPDDDSPSPPLSPDQARRNSMAARMAANRESRMRRSQEDASAAKRREEERQREDFQRRRALEESAKQYVTSSKPGKRKSTVPVKRNTQAADHSDDDLGISLARSRKAPHEIPIRQSPMRKAKSKANVGEPSSQRKDMVAPDLLESKPSPVKKVKKKVTRKKKQPQMQDDEDVSGPVENTAAPRKATKTTASGKRPPPARKSNLSKAVMEQDEDVSIPGEDHSSDDFPPLRHGRTGPGSRITTPGDTRPLGPLKSKGKLSEAAREREVQHDDQMDEDVEVAEEVQNGRHGNQFTDRQDAIEDQRQGASEEAERLRREQEQWKRKVRENRKKKEEEKRKRTEEDARYSVNPSQPADEVMYEQEQGDDRIQESNIRNDVTDNDDDDDVILVDTVSRVKRPAAKVHVPVSSPTSKDVDTEASKKKRVRSKRPVADPEEPSKRRKVADTEGESKSKQSEPPSKSASTVAKSARSRRASVTTPNDTGKTSKQSSRLEVETKASSLIAVGEPDDVMKEADTDDKEMGSPPKSTVRTTRVSRRQSSTQSDGAGRKTKGGKASAPGRVTSSSAKSAELSQGEDITATEGAGEVGGGHQPDAQPAAGIGDAMPATAQRGRSRAKKVSKPAPKSSPGSSDQRPPKPVVAIASSLQREPTPLAGDGKNDELRAEEGHGKGEDQQVYVSEREEVSVIQQLVYALETLDLQHVDLQEDLFAKVFGKLAKRPGLVRSTSLVDVDGEGLSHGVRQTRRRRELMRNIEAAKVAFQSSQQKALVSFVQAVSASLEKVREKGGGALGDLITSNDDIGKGDIFGIGLSKAPNEKPSDRSVEDNVNNENVGKAVTAVGNNGKASEKVKGPVKGRTRSGVGVGGRSGGVKKSDGAARLGTALPNLKSIPEVRNFVGQKYSSLNLNCLRSQAILTLCERIGGVGRSELFQALPFSSRVFDSKITELKNLGFINEWRSGEGTDGAVMYSTVTIAE